MAHRRPQKRRRTEGFTLVEVCIASTVMLLTSLALATVFSSTGLAGRTSERAVAIHTSFETALSGLEGMPYHELLSLNGTRLDRGDHVLEVRTRLVEVGLILVEIVALDRRNERVLTRLASYRSEER